MEYLTVTGNTSALPYKKNECSLFSESGECFIYKGWAVITDGGDDYEAVVYDGIIDLYKAIENKNLSDLTLTELSHAKTMSNVTNSWTDLNCKYKYILADYNGHTNLAMHKINMDYLVPSAQVKYLWDTIFSTYGFEYEGSVFDTEEFKNLYITFPKGVTPNDLAVAQLTSTSYSFALYGAMGAYKSYYARFNTATVNLLQSAFSNVFMQVQEAGTYRLELSGKIKTNGMPTHLYLVKNAMFVPITSAAEFKTIYTALPSNQEFTTSIIFNLEANDSIAIAVNTLANVWWSGYSINQDESSLSVNLVKIDGDNIDFQKMFSGFSIRDFLNEVVYRFGLTLYKDTYTNKYTFLTLQEQLQTPHIENWSNRFVKKISEKYEFSNYAQTNYMRYAYSNKEDNYYDASLLVANVNLADSKDILKSKIYAPNQKRGRIAQTTSNVYPLWEKDIEEDTNDEGVTTITTTYKPLENHFYFLRYQDVTFNTPKLLRSPTYDENYIAYTAPFETFWKLPFTDILQDYYAPLQAITNEAQVVTAQLWLTDADVATFDFKKLYYIEQLAAYFIMNKINNYIPGQVTKCEMVRVTYSNTYQPYLALTRIECNGLQTVTHFSHNLGQQNFMLQWHQGSNVWNNATGSSVSPITLQYPFAGTFYVRLWYNGFYSNTLQITLPSNQTVYA
jgi:hypothetical protein